jgi:hypothetical protein
MVWCNRRRVLREKNQNNQINSSHLSTIYTTKSFKSVLGMRTLLLTLLYLSFGSAAICAIGLTVFCPFVIVTLCICHLTFPIKNQLVLKVSGWIIILQYSVLLPGSFSCRKALPLHKCLLNNLTFVSYVSIAPSLEPAEVLAHYVAVVTACKEQNDSLCKVWEERHERQGYLCTGRQL